MKLASVSEIDLDYWFWRDERYFQRLKGIQCGTYSSNVAFNSKRPKAYQISLSQTSLTESKALPCVHFQTPTFVSMRAKYNYSLHMICEHDYQDYKQLMKI